MATGLRRAIPPEKKLPQEENFILRDRFVRWLAAQGEYETEAGDLARQVGRRQVWRHARRSECGVNWES